MSKRGNDIDPNIKEKKPKLELDDDDGQVQIGPVANIEVLNIRILENQNQRLVENNETRRRYEHELKNRIDNLEDRHTADESVIAIVNQFWNQFDEDVRLLLSRSDYDNLGNMDFEDRPALNSFLSTLDSWNHNEADKVLRNRVEFSKRVLSKLITAYDRNVQRTQKLWKLLSSEDSDFEKNMRDASKSMESHSSIDKRDDSVKFKSCAEKLKEISKAVKEELAIALNENKLLQEKNMKFHENHHILSVKNKHYEDGKLAAETIVAELKNKIDDLEHTIMVNSQKAIKMENNYKALKRSKQYNCSSSSGNESKSGAGTGGSGGSSSTSGESKKYQELSAILSIERELASSRLIELEKLQLEYQASLKNNESLKIDAKNPDINDKSISNYQCLKSHYTVLFSESTQMKAAYDETHTIIKDLKISHAKTIAQMELNEIEIQKGYRDEIITLEDTLCQLKREYQMLRVEFEQTLANNEKSAPINAEMRSLIISLKKYNDQIKGELNRYRKKSQDFDSDIAKIKLKLLYSDEEESIAYLRQEQKISELKIKDLQMTIDSFKSSSKETREIAEIIKSEKKALSELEEIKIELETYKSHEGEIKKIDFPKNEIKILDLQSCLKLQKQEESTVINEMELTGQAFEEMQEQNIKLMTQIREKDDAHFKLMSERIKSNQVHGILREERDTLTEAMQCMRYKLDNQNEIVQTLAEREAMLLISVNLAEKELVNHIQATEIFKRKALESTQSVADLKLHLAKYGDLLKQSQKVVIEKTASLQQETFRYKRIQEEFGQLRKKYDRIKKMEYASVDDVLMEEIKEYKEQLMCQCCKVARKDAVLNKCYHVFCLNCLRTRYETRQRKCPKCNATFGAKDFHRIYLES